MQLRPLHCMATGPQPLVRRLSSLPGTRRAPCAAVKDARRLPRRLDATGPASGAASESVSEEDVRKFERIAAALMAKMKDAPMQDVEDEGGI